MKIEGYGLNDRDSNRSRGFTIIELLITIVVIGILAAITIVAFRGLNARAEAASITSHVRQYVNILEAYIVDNGRAPSANWRCLGDSTTLPAVGGYSEGFCYKPANSGTDTSTYAPADPTLMANLTATGSKLPPANFPDALCLQGRTCRGIIYDGSTNNFSNNPAVITYFTKLQSCPIGDKVDWWTQVAPETGSGCAYRLSVNEFGVPK